MNFLLILKYVACYVFFNIKNMSVKCTEVWNHQNKLIWFFFWQSEDAKAQEAIKKELQETEKLKTLFSDCKVFLSREVPREILVFVLR